MKPKVLPDGVAFGKIDELVLRQQVFKDIRTLFNVVRQMLLSTKQVAWRTASNAHSALRMLEFVVTRKTGWAELRHVTGL